MDNKQAPMRENQGSVYPPENPRPAGAWLLWFLLGLAPLPIGLLIGPIQFFNAIQNSQNKSLLVTYTAITGVFTFASGIGQTGGFKTRKVTDIAGGIMLGLGLGGLNLLVVFFAGCCSAFSRI